jgi:hypothetical protein
MKYYQANPYNITNPWWSSPVFDDEELNEDLGRMIEIDDVDSEIDIMVTSVKWRPHPRSNKTKPWKITWTSKKGGPGEGIGEDALEQVQNQRLAARRLLYLYGSDWKLNVKLDT